MYTLRTITENNIERNFYLGESYSFTQRELNYEEFSRLFKTIFNEEHVADLDELSNYDSKNCYGFINESKGISYPLYKDEFNYIVSENGKTFSNLTYK